MSISILCQFRQNQKSLFKKQLWPLCLFYSLLNGDLEVIDILYRFYVLYRRLNRAEILTMQISSLATFMITKSYKNILFYKEHCGTSLDRNKG